MPYIIDKDAEKSTKLSRASILTKYLCVNIDESQDIRRLCRYLTLEPLAEYAIDYDGNIIMQPDLQDSLLDKTKVDVVSKGCEERILFRTMFANKVIESLHPLIYVYCDEINFHNQRNGSQAVGTMLFYIDIVYDIATEELYDWEQRSWSIGQIIMDMFDSVPITDEEYTKLVGNITFTVGANAIVNKKLAPNTTLGVLSIPLYAHVTGGRY